MTKFGPGLRISLYGNIKNDVNISDSTLDSQEEEYKYKYEDYQPKFNTLTKLKNVSFLKINLQRLLISITISQTVKTTL